MWKTNHKKVVIPKLLQHLTRPSDTQQLPGTGIGRFGDHDHFIVKIHCCTIRHISSARYHQMQCNEDEATGEEYSDNRHSRTAQSGKTEPHPLVSAKYKEKIGSTTSPSASPSLLLGNNFSTSDTSIRSVRKHRETCREKKVYGTKQLSQEIPWTLTNTHIPNACTLLYIHTCTHTHIHARTHTRTHTHTRIECTSTKHRETFERVRQWENTYPIPDRKVQLSASGFPF